MDPDISSKKAKSWVCLFCGDFDMFGPSEIVCIGGNGDPKYFAEETLSSSTLCRMHSPSS